MSEPTGESRPPRSTMVRAVGLLDLSLGFWAVAIAAGYVYLRFENFRMVVNGTKVNMFGAFYGIAINSKWVAMVAGMDHAPGGSNNAIPGAPGIGAFSTFRVMNLFAVLAPAYLLVAVACFAMADGLSRGLRWARRAHVVLGRLGLAVVAGYGVLYLLSLPYAPPAGLLVVAGSATVPAAMIRAGRAPREESGSPPGRRRLGLPSWTLIASAVFLLAGSIHVVLAWWSLLLIKACCF